MISVIRSNIHVLSTVLIKQSEAASQQYRIQVSNMVTEYFKRCPSRADIKRMKTYLVISCDQAVSSLISGEAKKGRETENQTITANLQMSRTVRRSRVGLSTPVYTEMPSTLFCPSSLLQLQNYAVPIIE